MIRIIEIITVQSDFSFIWVSLSSLIKLVKLTLNEGRLLYKRMKVVLEQNDPILDHLFQI